MQNLLDIIGKNTALIISFLIVLSFIQFIFIIVINSRFLKLNRTYKKMIKTLEKGDVFDIFSKIATENEEIKDKLDKLHIDLNGLDREVKTAIKKVGIVRYNAFSDVGSDLSFSIALLDSNDNGIVLSGIYGRNETATFAKPIERGQSKYPLSAEEVQAIERAKRKAL
ncbi:hypothetical protein TKV_c24680 [Thermoanaerobacter kivui]|uniref:DUF4446 domain-containing protein n=1 Tax=Thermoanaerobacter kivui TaxID=2325 RepID=A0A097AUW3_THEKI|nr:DUF4446 family protein [Thermoanaerobacter kivui]AIS53585.1 hypothetical protein TKV_c24680 [Thermoanaerobacter kivui]